jgi:hypothetical protein
MEGMEHEHLTGLFAYEFESSLFMAFRSGGGKEMSSIHMC